MSHNCLPTKVKRAKWAKYKKRRLSHEPITGNCHYCHTSLNKKNFSFDHKVPLHKEGDLYSKENLIKCCRSCNSLKGDMDYHVFIKRKDKLLTLQKEKEESRKIENYFAKEPSVLLIEEEFNQFLNESVVLVKVDRAKIQYHFNEKVNDEVKNLVKETVKKIIEANGSPIKRVKILINANFEWFKIKYNQNIAWKLDPITLTPVVSEE